MKSSIARFTSPLQVKELLNVKRKSLFPKKKWDNLSEPTNKLASVKR